MYNEKYGYIVTKPLQLLVALSIIEQSSPEIINTIIIVDGFNNSEDVYKRAKKNLSNTILFEFAKSYDQAYKSIRNAGFDKILIDSDVGGRKFITLFVHKIFNFQKKIAVYEEGYATYEANLNGCGRFFRLLRFFGVGTYFGGSIFVDEVFLFQPDIYNKTFIRNKSQLSQINKKISNLINENIYSYLSIFVGDYRSLLKDIGSGNSCVLYLTEWLVDIELIDSLIGVSILFIKPHPHIRSKINYENRNCKFISGSVPAELIVKLLTQNYEKVTVHHHGSSVERYIIRDNLQYIRHKSLSF